ncbi:blastula protease 10 [Hyalella azteca]|uniref:Blastula protease 10 n=1 Tax=Hyalella azteca TaxID=294128 RepID=A0A8B7NNJ5_HYAAZ|nr:blastula protease 10 [Hyalella azteca]
MHYGSSYFSKNGLSTIVPKNPLAESLLGNRADFSFWDLKLVNLQYRCTKTFLNDCQLAEDPCQNDGYTGPACTCLCPPGTSGSRCETRVGDYTETLVQERFPHSARFTTPGVISSPGYPDNLPTGTGKYIQELKAPECHKVQLVFTEFVLMQRPDSPVPCLYQGLTLRLQDPPIDSNVFCGRDIAPGRVFKSAGRSLVLNFVNYYPKTTPSKYRAEFIFIWNTEKCGEQE